MRRSTRREAAAIGGLAAWRHWRRRRAERRAENGTAGGRAAAAAGTAVSGVGRLLIALVNVVVAVVALVLLAGILLVVLEANRHNALVSNVHDAAKALAGPFNGLFKPHNHKLEIAVNWGIALAVYVAIGRVIVRVLAATQRVGGRARLSGAR